MITDFYTTDFSIYRVSSSIDVNNQEIETNEFHLSSSGRFEPLSGVERYFSDRKEAYTTHRIFCDVLDIVEKDTLQIDGVDYGIDAVLIQTDRTNENHLEISLIGII